MHACMSEYAYADVLLCVRAYVRKRACVCTYAGACERVCACMLHVEQEHFILAENIIVKKLSPRLFKVLNIISNSIKRWERNVVMIFL